MKYVGHMDFINGSNNVYFLFYFLFLGKIICLLSVYLDCTKTEDLHICLFVCRSFVLFTRPISTNFSKFFFKIGSHGTIHTFKNYFATVFSVFRNKRYLNRPLDAQW